MKHLKSDTFPKLNVKPDVELKARLKEDNWIGYKKKIVSINLNGYSDFKHKKYKYLFWYYIKKIKRRLYGLSPSVGW